jgi:NDP-sugar pyrophosphorylase family protein
MKAVVLAGGQEYGQCPLSRQAPRALWPLIDKPIIESVLAALQDVGIGEMAISANGRTHDIMDRLGTHPSPDVTVHYSEDPLPRGAAGCLKDCEQWLGSETFVVVPGASLLVGVSLADLIAQHRASGAALTVGAEPDADGDAGFDAPTSGRHLALKPTGIYVCEPVVLEHIKTRGYQDMKEQLIPKLVQAGLKVRAVAIRGRVIAVRNEECYLNAMVEVMEDAEARQAFTGHLSTRVPGSGVWIHPQAQVHAAARVVGPAYIGAGARIDADAVVIGPAIVGEGCQVGAEAVVHESILWRGARVGRGAMVEQAVMSAEAVVGAGVEVRGSIVVKEGLSAAERQTLGGSWDLSSADLAPAEPRRWWKRLLSGLKSARQAG